MKNFRGMCWARLELKRLCIVALGGVFPSRCSSSALTLLPLRSVLERALAHVIQRPESGRLVWDTGIVENSN